MHEEYSNWGLTINESKTEFLSTSSLSKIELEGFEFEATDNFKYLGSMANGSLDRKWDKRIVEEKKVIGMLSSVLWNTNIIASTKRKIYSTISQSIALCGSENWTLKKRQKERLLALEVNFWSILDE